MAYALAAALLLLAPLAWLALCPLVVHCAGRLSNVHSSHGWLALGLWPVGVALASDQDGVRLRARLFGLTVWRGRPSGVGRDETGRGEPRKHSHWTARLPSRAATSRIARFLAEQRHQLRLDVLHGATTLGFEDYADTGYLDGLFWSLRGAYPAATRDFRHQPDWSGTLHLDARGELRVRVFWGRSVLAVLALVYGLWRDGELSRRATVP